MVEQAEEDLPVPSPQDRELGHSYLDYHPPELSVAGVSDYLRDCDMGEELGALALSLFARPIGKQLATLDESAFVGARLVLYRNVEFSDSCTDKHSHPIL